MLKINPRTHEVTTHFSGLAFPNGFAEDKYGNFYVTDSLLGRTYKFTSEPDSDTVWFEDPALLSTNPNQNVGANDLAFDANEDFLYVTNAGNRQVLRIPFSRDGAPAGPIQVFADGPTLDQQLGLPNPTALNSADGQQFDLMGNLYVMSNQTDEVEVFSPDGALTNRYSGTGVNAMSFNASPIFKGSQMYITNMSATDGGVNSKYPFSRRPIQGFHFTKLGRSLVFLHDGEPALFDRSLMGSKRCKGWSDSANNASFQGFGSKGLSQRSSNRDHPRRTESAPSW